jgi:hypothetical protein
MPMSGPSTVKFYEWLEAPETAVIEGAPPVSMDQAVICSRRPLPALARSASPIVSIRISLIAVFIPLVVMGGIIGPASTATP